MCNWSVQIFYFFLIQFGKLNFLWICPFLPGYPFNWHVVHSLYRRQWSRPQYFPKKYFCIVFCSFSIFISIFTEHSPFYPWWVCLMICLFYPLKEQVFSFIDLCYSLLHFLFTYFCSDFYDFFLFYELWRFFFLILLFPDALGVWLGCLFDVSLVSWGRHVLQWTSLLLTLLLLNPMVSIWTTYHFPAPRFQSVYVSFLPHFREIFNYYLTKYFLMFFHLLLLGMPMIWMLGCSTLSQRPLMLFSFLFILFSFSPRIEVGLLYTAFIRVLFFYSFIQSLSFACSI